MQDTIPFEETVPGYRDPNPEFVGKERQAPTRHMMARFQVRGADLCFFEQQHAVPSISNATPKGAFSLL